ncbi:ABC transporter permease [Echinicola sp. CAU 1574]|uniref:ABC transporter permease n=1 Tax=Echinicola arenosa TaxID=2774144 RepID=A0ABR9AHK9_9BACT|nr:ABC transporter permease [Echinicola arenosa]MBD8488263.1 ABC transporter permease [Echinicola arenosa]
MILHYIKYAYWNFINQRPYSFINLIGLSLGMWIVFLALLMVTHHTGFDTFHKNYKNIYRVLTTSTEDKQNISGYTNPAVIGEMSETVPEIINYSRYAYQMININGVLAHGYTCFADPDIVDLFTFQLLYGDFGQFNKASKTMVVSASFAKKHFKNIANATGQFLDLSERTGGKEQKEAYRIVAVFKDFPVKSTFRPDLIVPIENSSRYKYASQSENRGDERFNAYLTLKTDADIEWVEQKINEIEQDKSRFKTVFKLQPLEDVHLHSGEITWSRATQSVEGIFLFAGIGVLVLIISLLNFMLLYSAISERNTKSMALRKVMGMDKMDTLKIVFIESLLICLVAGFIGAFLLHYSLGYINEFLRDQLVLSINENWSFFVIAIALIFITAFLTSIYFYRHISRHGVIEVLEKQASPRHNLFFGNGVVLAQLVIVTAMLVFSFAYYKQLDFMMNQGKGFNTDKVIHVYRNMQGTSLLEDVILQHPDVKGIAIGESLPVYGSSQKSVVALKDAPTQEFVLEFMNVDENFIPLYEIQLKEGRNFSTTFTTDATESIIINEAAAKLMNLKHPIGTVTNSGTIIGVVADFKFETFKKTLKPMFFRMINKAQVIGPVTVKFSTESKQSFVNGLEDLLEENQFFVAESHPDIWQTGKGNGVFIEKDYVERTMSYMYADEKTLQKVVSFFTLMAILISLMGIVGMFLYKTERHAKEIGIRKVNGASVKEILLMLNGDFAKWIVLAFVIACPVAYYVTQKWLENFAYKTTLDWWIFGLAGLLTLVVALLTVSGLSYRAAITNPVNVLKDE